MNRYSMIEFSTRICLVRNSNFRISFAHYLEHIDGLDMNVKQIYFIFIGFLKFRNYLKSFKSSNIH